MPKKLAKGQIALTSVSASTPPSASSQPRSVLNDDLPLPRIFVFDLDYTLWPLWVDTHVTPPLKPVPNSNQTAAVDKLGDTFSFYPDVPAVLHALPQAAVSMAVASRTTTPDLARDMLKILHIVPPPARPDGSDAGSDGGGKAKKEKARRAADVFDGGLEMYPGSKIRHMEVINKRTGIPYTDMLFFDDESRNFEVESLGVTMCLVRDGVTWAEVERGVKLWRDKRKSTR